MYESAVEALSGLFFVGLQEHYEVSVKLLLRELDMGDLPVTIERDRDQANTMYARRIAREKRALEKNNALMTRTREVNKYDMQLYNHALSRFCETIQRHPDLYKEAQRNKKSPLKCPS